MRSARFQERSVGTVLAHLESLLGPKRVYYRSSWLANVRLADIIMAPIERIAAVHGTLDSPVFFSRCFAGGEVWLIENFPPDVSGGRAVARWGARVFAEHAKISWISDILSATHTRIFRLTASCFPCPLPTTWRGTSRKAIHETGRLGLRARESSGGWRFRTNVWRIDPPP